MTPTETPSRKEQALAAAMERGNRVRVLIGDRKMKIPGVLVRDGSAFKVRANWGKAYDVPTSEELKELEVADSTGRFHTLNV